MKKTILFDVDGTLIDTEKPIIKAFQKTLKEELNLEVPDEELFYILGIPGKIAIKKYSTEPVKTAEIMKRWEINDRQMFHYSTLFEGIEKTLKQLKKQKIQLGIVTSRTDQEMGIVLNNFDIEQYFDTFITASKTKLHKPNPEPILKAIETLNLDPENVIYIGDSIYDFQCAKNAQVAFGLAGWGAKENPEFTKVDYHLTKPIDLLKLI